MAKNSLFAKLLRSPWWLSFGIAVVLALVASALLPAHLRVVGALSGFPFVVVAAMAAKRQWRLPSEALVAKTLQAVGALGWVDFARLLEESFRRSGYAVRRGSAPSVDFELERQGRRLLVSARRWKSARTGVEVLRALQAARESSGADDALCICPGELTDSAQPFASAQGIQIWGATELTQALRGLPLPPIPPIPPSTPR